MSALGSSSNHKRKPSNALDDDYHEGGRGNRRRVLSVGKEQRDTASQRELRAKTQGSRKTLQSPSVREAGPSTQKSTKATNSRTQSHSPSPTRSLTTSIKSENSGSDSDSSELPNSPEWMYFNETERLEALAYKAKTKARAKRERLRKAPAASADGPSQGQKSHQPALHSLNLTIDEILEAGFTEEEFFRAKSIRHEILQVGTREQLIEKAVRAAQRQSFDKNKPRGLWFLLERILVFTSLESPEIPDAVDFSWPLPPSPTELQDDSSYDEITGHLSLVYFSFECYLPDFSSDKESESHFFLFVNPFSDNSAGADLGNNDLARFKDFSTFINTKITLDNGPARDRFGLFVTKTEGWAGTRYWWEAPFHGWVAWLSKRENKRFQLIIFDPNFISLPRTTIQRFETPPAQEILIHLCLDKWKTLDKDHLFIIGNEAGSPKGKCLQLCSEWLQETLGNENWRNFPLQKEHILQMAAPIEWSDSRPTANPFSRRNSLTIGSSPKTCSRSGRSSYSVSQSRPVSPRAGPTPKLPNKKGMKPPVGVIIPVQVSTLRFRGALVYSHNEDKVLLTIL